MRILTSRQMKEAEAAADASGTSYEQLMENAGTAAAEAILRHAGSSRRALILCGKGNNGGDGLVIARLLSQKGWTVFLSFLCGEELSPLSRLNLERLPETVRLLPAEEVISALDGAEYLIDGVFGTGFHGELPQKLQQVFEKANRTDAVRVALDIPSGMNCDTGEVSENTFCADFTCTFGAYKPALVMEETLLLRGEVLCLDIGL